MDSFKRELISHLGWDRAVWKKGPAGSCERPRVISRANGVTVAGARGMRYPALSLSLTESRHNQLAVKADGEEMRGPLGEQRGPLFRDGGGRFS